MARYITVIPAYGRDYQSAAAVMVDWRAGKDFRIADLHSGYDGSFLNCADAPRGATVNVRYARHTKVLPIKVPS